MPRLVAITRMLGVDQLEHVAVAGHDHHVDALLRGLLGERGDHVVGLVAVDPHVLVAERLDQRLEVRPLLREQVGPLPALRLVVLVDLVAARHARRPRRRASPSAPYSVRIFTSIEAKPKIALVGCPARWRSSPGSAKKAR